MRPIPLVACRAPDTCALTCCSRTGLLTCDASQIELLLWVLGWVGLFRGGRCFSGHFPSAPRANSGDARDPKRVKMSECSFEALPREIQLRILREGLITVKGDTHLNH